MALLEVWKEAGPQGALWLVLQVRCINLILVAQFPSQHTYNHHSDENSCVQAKEIGWPLILQQGSHLTPGSVGVTILDVSQAEPRVLEEEGESWPLFLSWSKTL